MARNAPCSRYLYLANVPCFTSMIVRLLTNIAHTHNHNAMIKIFLLNANAPITPSNEKLASNTSRYKNKESQALAKLLTVSVGLFNNHVSPSMRMKTINPHIPAEINPNISVDGRNLETNNKVSKHMMISTAC